MSFEITQAEEDFIRSTSPIQEVIKDMTKPTTPPPPVADKPGPMIVSVWELVSKDMQEKLTKYPTNVLLQDMLAKHLPRFPGSDKYVVKPLDTLVARLKALMVPKGAATPQSAEVQQQQKNRIRFTVQESVSGHNYFTREDEITCWADDVNPADFVGLNDAEIREKLSDELVDNWSDYENDRHYGDEENGDSESDESETTGHSFDRNDVANFICRVRDLERGEGTDETV